MANKIFVAAVLVLMVYIGDVSTCERQSDCPSCQMCARNNLLCIGGTSSCNCISNVCAAFDVVLQHNVNNRPVYGKLCSCNFGSISCTGQWNGQQPTNFPEYTETSC